MNKIIKLTIALISYCCFCLLSVASDPPYHEMNGFGTNTMGGIAGKVIRVTNLNNEGPGSFRAACEDTVARLVLFEVGGVIDLGNTAITVTNPYLTIAGQTAPHPGITLIKGTLNISTHDVVVQHIAVRPGDAVEEMDAISTGGDNADVYNVVFDHCSATWATDENLSLINKYDNHDITLYRCLIAEGLNYNDHSCGSLIYGNISNLSIIGCLYAHNVRRNPRINNNTEFVMANNIFYNWASFTDNSGSYSDCVHLREARGSIVGNLVLGGSNTQDDGNGLYFVRGHDGTYEGEAYFEDNVIKHADGQLIIEENDRLITRLESKPLWPEGFIVKTVPESVDEVLHSVGAHAGDRDSIDKRIVNSVIQRTGNIINRQSDVEGYPQYSMTTRVLSVPDSLDQRMVWLDSLAATIDTDDSLDTSPLIAFVSANDIQEQPGLQECDLYLCRYNSSNTTITFKYQITKANRVTLKIYDMTGKEIETLVNRYQIAGEYKEEWISNSLPCGMYVCRLQAGKYIISKKFVLLK